MSHCDPTTLALAALGEDLDPRDAEHLEGCEQCLAEAAELVEVVTVGREAPSALPAVPDRVWAGIASELGLRGAPDGSDAVVITLPAPPAAAPPADPVGPAAPVVPLAPRRSRLISVAGIAAAAGALVGGAVVWASVDRAGTAGTSQPDEVVVAQAVLDPLNPTVAESGQAEVIDSPDGKVVRVDATALPPVDGYYEVWLIDEDVSGMIALGALPAGSIGTFTVPPGVSIDDFPILDISLEPLDGDPTHSKVSLLRGVLEA